MFDEEADSGHPKANIPATDEAFEKKGIYILEKEKREKIPPA